MSENPYTSGNIVSKDSAPGIIIASGKEVVQHGKCSTLSADGWLPRKQAVDPQLYLIVACSTANGTSVGSILVRASLYFLLQF